MYVYMYVYIYIYMYIYTHTHIYIYIYVERERERCYIKGADKHRREAAGRPRRRGPQRGAGRGLAEVHRAYTCVYPDKCVYILVYMCVCMCIHVCVLYIYIYIYIYTYTNTYLYRSRPGRSASCGGRRSSWRRCATPRATASS